MTTRLEMARQLAAEGDPYFKGYLDGLADRWNIDQEPPGTAQEATKPTPR